MNATSILMLLRNLLGNRRAGVPPALSVRTPEAGQRPALRFALREFKALTKIRGILSLLCLVCALPASAQDKPISLAGPWRFDLDRADQGLAEKWFDRALPQRINLPGALQNQGFGDDITVDTKWTGEVGTDRWKRGEQYAKYRQPGNIKVPFFLQPEKHYVGAAWYQREIEIPAAWQGQRVVLTLERPHWETRVWLDGRLIGTNDSLSTPHVHDLGLNVAPGRHVLTIRVDNRVIVEVGDWSHSVSDHTQGNWNGIVGKIELSATPPVWIENIEVHPNRAKKLARFKVQIGNVTGQPGVGKLIVGEMESPVRWDADGGSAEIEVEARPKLLGWDEFVPELLNRDVKLITDGGARSTSHVTYGLREVTTTPERTIAINGLPAFFRGTLECCIFPKTGYPPTDVAEWERILRTCKEYGLNHMRFHSWCPPEAAFLAADMVGFYFQVECGVWTQPGNGKRIDEWLYQESERIVRAYGNHPSFVLFTHGNEPHGPKREEYLAKWVNHWKRDGRFLVTSGSAYPQLPENQYHVHHIGRGPSGWLGKDYRKQYDQYNVPIIIHEMGQWCVYPNFDEIPKYTGPLKPKSFEIFRDSLAEHGMLDQWKDFLHASGKLQVLCYKEEIEAALRTPGVSGVQLLDLHDFPGQGTALVGVLDPFWESKGYVTPAEFRRFYSPTVPLVRLLKRTWTTDETLAVEVDLANYWPSTLRQFTWKLVDTDGLVVAKGELPDTDPVIFKTVWLGAIRIKLSDLRAPRAYSLVVSGAWSIDGIDQPPDLKREVPHPIAPKVENDWTIWVYPAIAPGSNDAVDVVSRLDEPSLARLAQGRRVLLATMQLSTAHPRLTFEPIFWNRYMFNTQNRQTLGLLCNPKHPALALFPTESWQDWQWHDIVTQARGVVLDELPRALRPIVQPIDDWNTNRKLGLLFECRVGPGRLLVCAADLSKDLDKRPAARQMRASLLAYAASERFNPTVEVSADDLTRVLTRASKSTMVNLGARVVKVDSEDRANGNLAANALDGDPDTIWHTRWQPQNDPMPHELVIDLGREVALKGITYLPRQEQSNGRIAEAEVFCGNDPQSWGAPVASAKWANTAELQKLQFPRTISARYLRLVVKAEVRQNPFASIAELDVITDRP